MEPFHLYAKIVRTVIDPYLPECGGDSKEVYRECLRGTKGSMPLLQPRLFSSETKEIFYEVGQLIRATWKDDLWGIREIGKKLTDRGKRDLAIRAYQFTKHVRIEKECWSESHG